MAAEAADVSAQVSQAASATSVHDRMKAFLGGSGPQANAADVQGQPKANSPTSDEGVENVAPEDKQVPAADKAADQADNSVDVQSDDAQSEDWQPSSLEELAEALGWDEEKLLGLAGKVKIDGKEGTATLRDLKKSYQLDGHINQKLATLDTERKALIAKQEEFQRERADKLLKMDASLKTLERAMMGEFQSVDWQKLAAEDPAAYNAQLVGFQQRNAMLQDIAGQISAESQQHQSQIQEAQKKWLEDQRSMLLAKVPEWSDEGRRAKDKAEILQYLDSVGFTKEEFEAVGDHRLVLVVRDAQKWHQLQKSKPAVQNKVKAAPKLLRPGTQQSKDAVNRLAMDKDRARLRQSGRMQDAVPALRRMMFGQ